MSNDLEEAQRIINKIKNPEAIFTYEDKLKEVKKYLNLENNNLHFEEKELDEILNKKDRESLLGDNVNLLIFTDSYYKPIFLINTLFSLKSDLLNKNPNEILEEFYLSSLFKLARITKNKDLLSYLFSLEGFVYRKGIQSKITQSHHHLILTQIKNILFTNYTQRLYTLEEFEQYLEDKSISLQKSHNNIVLIIDNIIVFDKKMEKLTEKEKMLLEASEKVLNKHLKFCSDLGLGKLLHLTNEL